MPTLEANGIDVYYERSGSGLPLLFVNGSMSTLEHTRPMVQVYAARFDVIAHDQRGLGKTSIPPGPYTMADYAGDALSLLDRLGVDRFRMVGTSFGGMVARRLRSPRPSASNAWRCSVRRRVATGGRLIHCTLCAIYRPRRRERAR